MLTTHLTASLGWLGAVVAFLALSIAGVSSGDGQIVRASYLTMRLVTWYVIVPFSLAALLTGIIESAGTPWGFVRHYWVAAKLALTVVATMLLLLHTQPIDRVADAASIATLSGADLHHLRLQLIGDASAAVFVLFVTTVLSVYKPWGFTPYGLRVQVAAGRTDHTRRRSEPRSSAFVLVAAFIFIAIVVVLHLAGLGLGHH